jgi:LysR family hydrogen peroxide-inducible transcriptional activator
LKLVLGCEIDFALASQPISDSRLELRELFSEELLLSLPPGHPLTRKRVIPVSDLENQPFILMKEGHCLGDQVLRFCERRDLRPAITFRSAQLETVQALISAGLGLSLIPAMAAAHKRGGQSEYRSLALPKPSRRIVAAWLKPRPPGRAAEAFLRMVETWGKATRVP